MAQNRTRTGGQGRPSQTNSRSRVPRDAKGRKRNLTPDGKKLGLAGKNGPVKQGNSKPRKPGGPDGASMGRGGATKPQKQRRVQAGAGQLIEGRRATEEALGLGLEIRRAFIAMGKGNQDPKLERLVRELEAAGARVDQVSKGKLDAMSSHGAHQGVIIEVAPFEYCDVEDIIEAAGTGDALVIMLDHVTDEGNLGAIVRSAEVVGASGVIIAKARAAAIGLGAYKTSAGAVMHLPIAQVPNLTSALQKLKDAGFWTCASTEHASQSAFEAPMGGRLCLVMGSESDGVSRLLRDTCDFEAKLPQRGTIESLNVAQAATVMAYEWLRQTSEATKETTMSQDLPTPEISPKELHERQELLEGAPLDTLGPDAGPGSFEAEQAELEAEGFEAGPDLSSSEFDD